MSYSDSVNGQTTCVTCAKNKASCLARMGLLRRLYATPPRRAVTPEGCRYERISICTTESARGSETAQDLAARDREGAGGARRGRAVRRRRAGGGRRGVHGGQLVRNQ